MKYRIKKKFDSISFLGLGISTCMLAMAVWFSTSSFINTVLVGGIGAILLGLAFNVDKPFRKKMGIKKRGLMTKFLTRSYR